MIQFKYENDMKLFSALHPILLMIFTDVYNYVYEKYGVGLVVTQTITTEKTDRALKRKSPAHRQGRALDIRTKDLQPRIVQDIINYLHDHKKYQKYKYTSYSGHKRLAFFHVGTNEHLHIAISSKFSNKIEQ